MADQAAQNMGTAVNQPLETGAAAVEVGESGRPVVEVEGDQVVEEEKPLTKEEHITDLRAKEQAEYDAMSDPSDQKKRDEIYDRYNKLISPLLPSQKNVKSSEKAEAPKAGSVGVGGDVEDYKGIFNPKKTGISGLDVLLKDDGYNYFYKGVSGEVVMMSPDEYLKRVREGLKTKEDANIIEDKKDAINEAINDGNKIDMPFILEPIIAMRLYNNMNYSILKNVFFHRIDDR